MQIGSHNGLAAGQRAVGWKIERGNYTFLREMRRDRDFFTDRLIAFVAFCVCAKLSGRFSRELFENPIELR